MGHNRSEATQAGGSADRCRDLLLVLLTLAAGAMDAVVYLTLGAFAANQTGNIVLLGLAAGGGDARTLSKIFATMASFVAGVAAGALVLRGARATSGPGRSWAQMWPPRVTVVIGLETVMLLGCDVGLLIVGTDPDSAVRLVLLSATALAMGLQAVAARSLHVAGMPTVAVTSNLTWFVSGLVSPSDATGRALHGSALIAYGLGAAVVAAVLPAWRPGALFLPASLAAVVLAVAAWRQAGSR